MICALTSLRELRLEGSRLLSEGLMFAPNNPFHLLKAPRLERVQLSGTAKTLFTQMIHWMATSEIFHTCVDLELEGDSVTQLGDDFFRNLGPSLTGLSLRAYAGTDMCAYSALIVQ